MNGIFKQKDLLNELIGYSNDFGALILRTDTDEYNHNLAVSILSSIINDIKDFSGGAYLRNKFSDYRSRAFCFH